MWHIILICTAFSDGQDNVFLYDLCSTYDNVVQCSFVLIKSIFCQRTSLQYPYGLREVITAQFMLAVLFTNEIYVAHLVV